MIELIMILFYRLVTQYKVKFDNLISERNVPM